jgi:hypothetical protein
MVKLFHSIMRLITGVPIWAFLMIFNVPTFLRLIVSERASSIFLVIVIVRTFLEVVALWVSSACHGLEEIEIQEWNALTHGNVLCAIITVLLMDLILKLWLYIRNYSPCHLLVHILLHFYV